MSIERRIRVVLDTFGVDSPRDYDTNVGRMLCWHRRYSLGDENEYDSDKCLRQLAFEHDADLEEYVDRLEDEVWERLYDRAANNGCESWEERHEYAGRYIRPRVDAAIERALSDGYVILPVFMYDHSGIALSTGPFSCPWDSGQVGWIVCDKSTVDKEFNGDKELAEKALRIEVDVYSKYVNGDVWGFIAEERDVDDPDEYDDDDEWEEVDSCWGFFGQDECIEYAKDAAGDDFADAEVVTEY